METQSPPDDDNPRKNRARDRHQKRKERAQGMAHATGAPTRQIRPRGSFQMPTIQMPTGSLRLILYGLAGAAFIALVIFVLGND